MKKIIVPVLGLVVMAILTTIREANSDGSISAGEWVMVAVQATMAINVYLTANLPQYDKMKTYVAATILVLQLLTTVIDGGLTTNEIINLVITGLSALGVAFIPQPMTTVRDGVTVTPTDRVSA